mgnify:CR=1 FL=1
MARLFLTEREMAFISDVTKEYIKDVVGACIYYYPISELKTKNHDVYNESIEKIYDNPIKIEAHVGMPDQKVTTGKLGFEQNWTLELYIQYRDMVDKGIQMSVGDFFSYGTIVYEIVNLQFIRNIYGQVENIDGIKVVGQNVREGQFKINKIIGPTSREFTDDDAIKKDFYQQRGFESNEEGETKDIRDLQKEELLGKPISGPAKVSKEADTNDLSSFYDE